MVDSMNEFVKLVSESESLSSIIIKGRASYSSLSESERLRFDHAHMFFFNNFESWLTQISHGNSLRQKQETIENIRGCMQLYCKYPGVVDYWQTVSTLYPSELNEIFMGSSR